MRGISIQLQDEQKTLRSINGLEMEQMTMLKHQREIMKEVFPRK